jgi:hypothetical protein
MAQIPEGQLRLFQEVDDLAMPFVRRPPIGDADLEIVEHLLAKGLERLEQK